MAKGVIEAKEGGKVSLMSGHIRGVVTGWRPNQFLAYSWNVFQPGETLSAWPVSYLEFALAADGANTKLTLTHRPISKAVQNQTLMGWHTFPGHAGKRRFEAKKVATREAVMRKNAPLYGVDFDNLKR